MNAVFDGSQETTRYRLLLFGDHRTSKHYLFKGRLEELTEQVGGFSVFLLQLLAKPGPVPPLVAKCSFLRQLRYLPLYETQGIDVPKTESADFARPNQLHAGIVLRLDLVRFAVQGQLQSGDGVEPIVLP